MKLHLCFTILAVLLQINIIFGITEAQLDKGCSVTNELTFSLLRDNLRKITFFITQDHPITIQVFFKGRKQYEDNDLLILNPYDGKHTRKRDGKSVTEDIVLNDSIPIGWNIMTITLQDRTLHIGNLYSLTKFEYHVNDISFTAKHLTDCANGTPMWEVDISEVFNIPVIGLTKFGMKLISVQQFHPEIALNTIDIPLSYDEEVIVRKSSVLLPPQEYKMVVEFVDSMVSLFSKTENDVLQLLMKYAIKEDLVNLKITSTNGAFLVIFDPFPEEINEKEAIKSAQCPEIQEIQVATKSAESTCPQCSGEAPSCTVWQITTGLGFVIGVTVTLILIFCLYRTRFVTQKMKVYGVEEGEASTPLLDKDPIKNRIKSEYTETHGEVNKQMNPHHKEVCKLMLRSDKKNDNKKILGDLNDNKDTKVILVVGETESGKSSFINGMTNFIYGVTYDDSFRLKLVADMDSSHISGANTTNDLIAYYIPYMPGIKLDCNYIFIDTPGFGDSRGVNEDRKWNQKFYDFLNKNPDINEVDGICFVIKATDTRLTSKQEYIMNGLFSMFGKDIQKNIYVVVSYSDGSQTHVPKLLKKSGLNYSLALYFNSRGIYSDEETTSDSSKSVQNYIKKCWDLNMKHLDHFFNRLLKTTSVSLSLTTVVLEENKDINKIRDEILELMANENYASDQEKQEIETRIQQQQQLLMIKLDEAKKLSGRLENIPAKKNPLAINEYIDMMIKTEEDKDKIIELQKLKERNTAFQKLLKTKNQPKVL